MEEKLTKNDIVFMNMLIVNLIEKFKCELPSLMTDEEIDRLSEVNIMNSDIDNELEFIIKMERLHELLVKAGIRNTAMPEYIN